MSFFDPMQLRAWLMAYQFWWLEFLFLAFVTTTALALPGLVRSLGVSVRWWLLVLLISATGLVVVYVVPPTTNRIYYDEQIYQNVGQNMADMARTQMCNYGTVEYGQLQCVSGEYNKEPHGYPYLLSVGYRLFGTSDSLAHHLNRLLHALMAIVLAITAWRWFERPLAGVFAALFISLIPEQLRWTATAAAEPSAAFFTLVAILAAVDFSRSRSTRSLIWLVAAGTWAIQFRPESVLAAFVAGAILVLESPAVFRDRRLWKAVGVLAVAAAIYGLHLASVRHESWGAGGAPFALTYLAPNLAVNGWFYIADARFPAWLFPLAVVGLVLGRASLAARLNAGIYFLLFWGIFLFFYAGSYNYGADVRYSLVSYAPLVLLAALGFTSALEQFAAPRRFGTACVLTTMFVIWISSWYAPYTRSVGEEAWAARADVAFAKAVSATLPKDALVLTQDPNMFHIWGVNAAQMSYATDPGLLERIASRHGRNVFVHWGFWCNVADDTQRGMCRNALEGRKSEVVREYVERDYRYVFYRITK